MCVVGSDLLVRIVTRFHPLLSAALSEPLSARGARPTVWLHDLANARAARHARPPLECAAAGARRAARCCRRLVTWTARMVHGGGTHRAVSHIELATFQRSI